MSYSSASTLPHAIPTPPQVPPGCVRLLLAGDVMLARGIDQIQKQHCEPVLYESYCKSAMDYVHLAENRLGRRIPRGVSPGYVWGRLAALIKEWRPDGAVINLECALTTSPNACMGKEVLYRAHPSNVAILKCLQQYLEPAPLVVSLANNHLLDWGREGLIETLQTLTQAGIAYVGAGTDRESAQSPVEVLLPSRSDGVAPTLRVVGIGDETSGVYDDWAATDSRSGVSWIPNPPPPDLPFIPSVPPSKPCITVLSVHHGSNWGYQSSITSAYRSFISRLTTSRRVDVVHSHSSHHPRPIELINNHLVLHGCGDLLNDYEGIEGPYRDRFRDDIALAYWVDVELDTGRTRAMYASPLTVEAFQLRAAPPEDATWLRNILQRECRAIAPLVPPAPKAPGPKPRSALEIHWSEGPLEGALDTEDGPRPSIKVTFPGVE